MYNVRLNNPSRNVNFTNLNRALEFFLGELNIHDSQTPHFKHDIKLHGRTSYTNLDGRHGRLTTKGNTK